MWGRNFDELLRYVVVVDPFDFLLPHHLKGALYDIVNVCSVVHLVEYYLVQQKVFLYESVHLLFELLLGQMLHLRHVLEEFYLLLILNCVKFRQYLLVIILAKCGEVAVTLGDDICLSQLVFLSLTKG